MKKQIKFDMEAAVKALREGKDLIGQDGILTPLLKQLIEAAMQADLEDHLLSEDQSNRKNGRTPKAMQSSAGEFEMNIQRDRSARFEPQIFKKHQTHLTDELEVSFEGASKELRRDTHSVLAGNFQSVCPCELSTISVNCLYDREIHPDSRRASPT